MSNISATPFTTSATITWTTDEPANSTVQYGTTTNYGFSQTSSSLVTSHSVLLTNLFCGTAYDYRVTSVDGSSHSTSSANQSFTTATCANPTGIKHVVVVIDENTDYTDAYNSTNMPWMTAQINSVGALATGYYANTHPSIGNYMELTTGQVLTNDDGQTPSSFPVSADNIVRELLANNLTWKAYCESIPSVGYIGGDTGQYAVRHCALPYPTDVQNSTTQRNNLVGISQFDTDIANNTLPSFSFVIGNLCDDAHDCIVPGSSAPDQWLQTHLGPLFSASNFYQDTLLIFTWDETNSDNTNGGGKVEWAAFGAGVKKAYQQASSTVYQHQSTLRLALQKLGVTTFPGDAANAPDMAEFFGTSSVPNPPSGLTATVH